MCFAAACRKVDATCESPGPLLSYASIVDNCASASFEGAFNASKGLRIPNASALLFQNPDPFEEAILSALTCTTRHSEWNQSCCVSVNS